MLVAVPLIRSATFGPRSHRNIYGWFPPACAVLPLFKYFSRPFIASLRTASRVTCHDVDVNRVLDLPCRRSIALDSMAGLEIASELPSGQVIGTANLTVPLFPGFREFASPKLNIIIMRLFPPVLITSYRSLTSSSKCLSEGS